VEVAHRLGARGLLHARGRKPLCGTGIWDEPHHPPFRSALGGRRRCHYRTTSL
jgi:hypothetical protein